MDLDKNRRIQQENVDRGRYQVSVVDQLSNRPVENARVKISYTGDPDSDRRAGNEFFRTDTGD